MNKTKGMSSGPYCKGLKSHLKTSTASSSTELWRQSTGQTGQRQRNGFLIVKYVLLVISA